MRDLPSSPSLADAPSDHLQGHVWVQEWLDAVPVHFAVAPAGYLQFGDGDRVFDETPPELRYARRFLDRTFDVRSYRDAVEDPSRYTFVGVATHRRSVDYDWDRLPPVLGTAVHDRDDDRWLAPDRVDEVFDALGPPPVNVLEKERSVDRQPLAGYDLPASAWHDGPAAGATFVDKRGNRARLVRENVPAAPSSVRVETVEPEALAGRFVTDDLIAARAAAVRDERGSGGGSVAFDPLFEAVLDRVARAHHGALFRGVTDTGAVDLDWGAFRGAVAERVRRWRDAND